MSTLSAYLQTWRLKLSHTKTVTTAFHLNNREAKRELKVYNNSRLLPFCPTPTYLGVKLNRSLTFRHHLVALRKKLSSRVTLLRRLVGSGWGAGAKTLRIATLSLVYSTAEYWCWAIPFVHAQMGLAPSPNCECGAFEQTADHVLTVCPIHRAPHGARGLTVLDDETRCWLNDITASV